MEDIIGILFYESFIELPGSNQTFWEKQGHFKLSASASSKHVKQERQAGKKQHATQCIASVCVILHHTKDIFDILL